MDCAFHTEDPRQRVADYAAVLVLTWAAAEHVDLSIARLGGIVAAFLPSLEPARLRAWSDMDMAKAVRTIKIDLLRHQIDLAEAGTGRQAAEPGRRMAGGRRKPKQAARQARRGNQAHRHQKLTEQEIDRLDEDISQSVVASFFKFMTMRALDPDWFAPYLAEAPAF